ncbi:MAG: azurin [Myxococcota bacterium]|jgi:azurin
MIALTMMLMMACTDDDSEGTAINPEPLPLIVPSITPDPITDRPHTDGTIGRLAVADTGQPAASLSLGTDGDQIVFAPAALTAPAGLIRLTFTNNATAPAMRHNVVIVTAGTEESVGVGGIQAGEAGHYVPDSPDVLAATTMLRAGTSASLVVDLPPGEYAFICTFPGHYLTMRGTLTVT